ncbi:MAG: hypothetical protein K5983_08450 [Lactobacillus sp.]|nr:hypothetical protein [Lactobacillus sp.]
MNNDERTYLSEKIKHNEELIADQEEHLKKLIHEKEQKNNDLNYDNSIAMAKDTIATAKSEIAEWKKEIASGNFKGYY